MNVTVRTEPAPGERRVAATPDSVRHLRSVGLGVTVQKGAGNAAGYFDAEYVDAGATLVPSIQLAKCEVLLHVRPLSVADVRKLPTTAITVGLASPASNLVEVDELRKRGIASFALELVPRISRAQSMDALTSQALVSGYRCVLEAAIRLPRFFPLYMTAAGTIPPASIVVLGAGVAGLQAIATAKRLGAKVSAYDVREASADEVRSMGGTFIALDLETADGAGGYATELAADRAKRQQDLLAPHLAQADVVITTAAIPGRPAPRLVTKGMLAGMRPGSVIVDLAAESGGNVEGSRPGEDVQVSLPPGGAITIVGMKDAPSTMAYDASRLYARNVSNLVALMTVDGRVDPDFSDEVVNGACLTRAGTINHAQTLAALEADSAQTQVSSAKRVEK